MTYTFEQVKRALEKRQIPFEVLYSNKKLTFCNIQDKHEEYSVLFAEGLKINNKVVRIHSGTELYKETKVFQLDIRGLSIKTEEGGIWRPLYRYMPLSWIESTTKSNKPGMVLMDAYRMVEYREIRKRLREMMQITKKLNKPQEIISYTRFLKEIRREVEDFLISRGHHTRERRKTRRG